ncbi:MAG: phosphate acyltransferase PlsX [Hyphomicrobiaceae bacterium]|nr:phosphate acyltransferase PlsX [Hyphomicrobiaceae bacterium]
MPGPQTLALDAMGGDHGPEVVVPGAALSLSRHPRLSFILFGAEERIRPCLAEHPSLAERARIVHTDLAIGMQDKPSQALRRGKGTSMWLALEAVKTGEAQAAVSAGNTGALMALARLILRPMPGIERPAIAAQWPTIQRASIVLDVGSNIGASARQLVDYALMGAAMARAHFGIERPTVGLLNVGVEEIKGNEEVRQAHAWLKQSELGLPIDYRGFVEGDQIGQGVVDVVVVEGFAGNIALKTAEGTARQIGTYLRGAMSQSVITRIGALLAKSGFDVLKTKMDPRRVNGGPFLGLNGIAIKSHGGTDALGFASAIDLGYEMADNRVIDRIAADIASIAGKLDVPAGGGQG